MDAGKLAKQAAERMGIGGKEERKVFGIGGKEEEKCETFRAFLACRGYLYSEKRAVELPSGSTLGDARGAFGRPMRQHRILDEDGYELDAASPVWRYSKNCNISLTFEYDKKTELNIATESVFSALNPFARKPEKEK